MATKYRKLDPDEIRSLAQNVTAATRAVIEMITQTREEPRGKVRGVRKGVMCQAHHLSYDAKELNLTVRALVDVTIPIREELFIAAKEVRKTKREARKAAPKCGALRASGGRCATPLMPGQFRCDIHAQELREWRSRKGGKTPGTPLKGGVPKDPATAKGVPNG